MTSVEIDTHAASYAEQICEAARAYAPLGLCATVDGTKVTVTGPKEYVDIFVGVVIEIASKLGIHSIYPSAAEA